LANERNKPGAAAEQHRESAPILLLAASSESLARGEPIPVAELLGTSSNFDVIFVSLDSPEAELTIISMLTTCSHAHPPALCNPILVMGLR